MDSRSERHTSSWLMMQTYSIAFDSIHYCDRNKKRNEILPPRSLLHGNLIPSGSHSMLSSTSIILNIASVIMQREWNESCTKSSDNIRHWFRDVWNTRNDLLDVKPDGEAMYLQSLLIDHVLRRAIIVDPMIRTRKTMKRALPSRYVVSSTPGWS